MIDPIHGDTLLGNILGENLMEATARLLGIALGAAIILGFVFWLI